MPRKFRQELPESEILRERALRCRQLADGAGDLEFAIKLKGTSNNDDFVIGSPAAVACRSFSLLIFRGSDCVYATSVRFYARRAHDTIMRRPFAPA